MRSRSRSARAISTTCSSAARSPSRLGAARYQPTSSCGRTAETHEPPRGQKERADMKAEQTTEPVLDRDDLEATLEENGYYRGQPDEDPEKDATHIWYSSDNSKF